MGSQNGGRDRQVVAIQRLDLTVFVGYQYQKNWALSFLSLATKASY